MTKPVDHIITELTDLATRLYDFLLRTEGHEERTGWIQQLEHCRKHVVTVRLLAGQSDFRGLHDVCLMQQEYLNTLLGNSVSPALRDWENLERWPLLVLPCIATPVSQDAVDQMVEYCIDVGMPIAGNIDARMLRDNLLKFSGAAASATRVVSLPFASPHNVIVEAREHNPVSDTSSVRYLLQHDLMDALSEYSGRKHHHSSLPQDALRLCTDRIQLLGISAAGAGLTGLMDCCLLCHDALNRCLARDGLLNDAEDSAFKTWTGLVSRYLETPGDRAVIEALINFYQRGNFVARLTDRDYDNLLEMLIRDGKVERDAVIAIDAVNPRMAEAALAAVEKVENTVGQSTSPARLAVDPVTDQLRIVEQHVTAARVAATQLQQLTCEIKEKLSVDGELNAGALNELAQCMVEASNASGLAAQSAQSHINTLGDLIAARASTAPAVSKVHAILIRCCSQVLAIAIHGVERIFHSGSGETVVDDHRLRYCVDDSCYSASVLETLLQLPVDHDALSATERSAILVSGEQQLLHIVFVEQVLAAQEIDVQVIGPYMPDFPGITGVTTLPSGELAPVIDMPELLRLRASRDDTSYALETESLPGGSA